MKLNLQRQWPNTEGFETGINVFDKEEQEKMQVRAERFGIDPDESQATRDDQLQALHDSLGITDDTEKNVRFEAIHMNGIEEMSTQDVFVYFEIFAPSSIEWINDTSCNVVWNDRISAARALLQLSEPIRGMPVEGPCDPFVDKTEEDEDAASKGRSILLMGKDRDIELKDDYEKENGNAVGIHVSDITVPVPPGYWRLGKPTEKTKFMLLRFAHRTDRKPFRAERFSQYYKKHGNPNFGGLKGIISESKKKKMKGIFDRHDSINLGEVEPEPPVSGNPWGSLARNWHRDKRLEKTVAPVEAAPSLPVSSGILNRLGHKRAVSSESESDSPKPEAKKSKVPRMRMYADEEEEKIRRKKALKVLGKVQQVEIAKIAEKPDLRRKLNQTDTRHRVAARIPEVVKPETSREFRDVRDREFRDVREREFRDVRDRIPRREVPGFRMRRPEPEVYSDPEESDDDGSRYQQKSKVTVIIKKQRKPTVASTVWSRMNDDKTKKKTREVSDEEEEEENNDDDDEESSSESEDEATVSNREKLRAAINRPGFGSGNLKSRLGVKSTEHKSPLRIEINNDLFKSKSAK